MTIADLEHQLGCKPLVPYEDAPLAAAYTSDLLSDVMAHAPEDGCSSLCRVTRTLWRAPASRG